jgi:hypothetical protein
MKQICLFDDFYYEIRIDNKFINRYSYYDEVMVSADKIFKKQIKQYAQKIRSFVLDFDTNDIEPHFPKIGIYRINNNLTIELVKKYSLTKFIIL